MSDSARTPQREITVFFCARQEERVARIFQELSGPGAPIVRRTPVPCSGKLEIIQLTRALEEGAAAVALFGCAEAECRYVFGSPRGRRRVLQAARILGEIGLEKERVRRFVLPAEPGPETLDELTDWLEKIKAIRPIGPI